MKYRKLRIAWSVAWDVAAVPLIVLWVRTQFVIDGIVGPISGSTGFGVMSRNAGLGFVISWDQTFDLSYYAMPPGDPPRSLQYESVLGVVEYLAKYNAYRVRFPYWFLLLCSMLVAMMPWLPFRFSLRTLLLATTVVAVGLGVVVWVQK